ncbi:hypothetical protein P9112_001252 [Eukaryota sp. TZLM1-RC]
MTNIQLVAGRFAASTTWFSIFFIIANTIFYLLSGFSISILRFTLIGLIVHIFSTLSYLRCSTFKPPYHDFRSWILHLNANHAVFFVTNLVLLTFLSTFTPLSFKLSLLLSFILSSYPFFHGAFFFHFSLVPTTLIIRIRSSLISVVKSSSIISFPVFFFALVGCFNFSLFNTYIRILSIFFISFSTILFRNLVAILFTQPLNLNILLRNPLFKALNDLSASSERFKKKDLFVSKQKSNNQNLIDWHNLIYLHYLVGTAMSDDVTKLSGEDNIDLIFDLVKIDLDHEIFNLDQFLNENAPVIRIFSFENYSFFVKILLYVLYGLVYGSRRVFGKIQDIFGIEKSAIFYENFNDPYKVILSFKLLKYLLNTVELKRMDYRCRIGGIITSVCEFYSKLNRVVDKTSGISNHGVMLSNEVINLLTHVDPELLSSLSLDSNAVDVLSGIFRF